MARQELCFIAFPIVFSTESFNNGQKLSRETQLFLEYREVRYPVGPLDFLEGDFLTVSSSPPSLLPTTSASSAMFDGEFSADLAVELVQLPTSASSALSIDDSEFSADQVRVILSIEVSGMADLLKL